MTFVHLFLLFFCFLHHLPGDFTERHPSNCWSQRKYGTSSFPDLSNNPRGFDARRGVLQLQTEWCSWREDCRSALEGQAVSWTQRGRDGAPTGPPALVPLARRSSPFAPGWAELLAPHGQRLQCLNVATFEKAGGEGWGQRQGWDTEASPNTFTSP